MPCRWRNRAGGGRRTRERGPDTPKRPGFAEGLLGAIQEGLGRDHGRDQDDRAPGELLWALRLIRPIKLFNGK